MTAYDYDPNNIFAKILRGEMPSHCVYEDEHTYVMMDIMPRADGHCLVLPKQAARNMFDVSEEAVSAVARTTAKVARAAKRAFKADGITIQQFNEAGGGQVVFHLHVHIIPRKEGEKLKPHTGQMADQTVLAAQCELLKAELTA